MSKKGQISTTDLFVAIFVFLILLTTILVTWNVYSNRLNEGILYENLLLNAFYITDTLVKSQGQPDNWTLGNVETIGLSFNDRNLSKNKVEQFVSMDYNYSKEMFNVERYDFYFQIEDPNGANLIDPYGVIGVGENIVRISRVVVYDGGPAYVRFTLWE